MKIYIASSWKNEDAVEDLAELLRSEGHAVDCFCDESTGRFVFSFRELDGHEDMNCIEFLTYEKPQRAFKEDKKWIDWAEAVVMLLPCGKSAHLEAGYAKGQGKKLYIIGEFKKGDFDVMYGFADGLFEYESDLLDAIERDEA